MVWVSNSAEFRYSEKLIWQYPLGFYKRHEYCALAGMVWMGDGGIVEIYTRSKYHVLGADWLEN